MGNRMTTRGRLLIACVAACALRAPVATADRDVDAAAAQAATVARGRYIVEDVAVCWRCHSPRDANGEFDRSRWLEGGPVPFVSATQTDDWADVAPRLAGLPPGTDSQFITLLTTGIARTGRPPRPPMPQFRMSRDDAAAVLAYLKSIPPRP
jgi:mono/diheme cytochrome c family protein